MASTKDKKNADELDAVSAAYESISAKLEELRKKQAELAEESGSAEAAEVKRASTDTKEELKESKGKSDDDEDAIEEIDIDSESEEEVEIKVKGKKSSDESEEELNALPGTDEPEEETPRKQIYKANDPLDDENVKEDKLEADSFEEEETPKAAKRSAADEDEELTLSQRAAKIPEGADEMEAWEKLKADSGEADKEADTTPKPTFAPVSQEDFQSKLRRPQSEEEETPERDEDAFGAEVPKRSMGQADEPDSLDDLAEEPIDEPPAKKAFSRPTEVDGLEEEWGIRKLRPQHPASFGGDQEMTEEMPEREFRRPPVRENNYFDNRNQPLPRKKGSIWHLLILLLIGAAVIGGTVYVLKYQFNAPPKPTPTPEISSPSPVPTPTPEPPKTVEDRSQFKVRVLNGTTKTGWASEILKKLKDAGFQTDRAGNAPKQDVETTVIKVKEGSQSAALIETIKQDLGSEFSPTGDTSLDEKDKADAEITLGTK